MKMSRTSHHPVGSWLRALLIAIWLPVALVALWWWASESLQSPFFPPLRAILERFATQWLGSGFLEHAVPSLTNLLVGLVIAIVLGIALGTFLGLRKGVEETVSPVLHFARSLPAIALLPVMMVLFGTGPFSKTVLIFWGAFWPVLLNTIDGVRLIPPQISQMTAVYRVTPANRLFRVTLPGAFPQISIGITLSISIALVLMIASEIYGSTQGIGYVVLTAQQSFRTVDVWAGVLLLGILGYLFSKGYSLLETNLLRWRAVR